MSKVLLEMLTHKRPHMSSGERIFVEKYIVEPNIALGVQKVGPMENIVICTDFQSRTLFSCHTDTVHSEDGVQEVMFDKDIGMAYKNDRKPLGADDTTGVWIMLEMIKSNIPGTYVFHRGEERGCIGSHWMALNSKDFLMRFDRAIAFDRRDETNVITHQRGKRCCSDDFAKSLAKALGNGYEPDPTGLYTDTASYTAIIPECTNISVGYMDQHTADECQNIWFANKLLSWLKDITWENLPTVREAKEESFAPTYNFGNYQSRSSLQDDWDRERDDAKWPAKRERIISMGKHHKNGAQKPKVTPKILAQTTAATGRGPLTEYKKFTLEEFNELTLFQLESICRTDATFAAELLQELLDIHFNNDPVGGDAIEDRMDIVEDGLATTDERIDEAFVELDRVSDTWEQWEKDVNEEVAAMRATLMAHSRMFQGILHDLQALQGTKPSYAPPEHEQQEVAANSAHS